MASRQRAAFCLVAELLALNAQAAQLDPSRWTVKELATGKTGCQGKGRCLFADFHSMRHLFITSLERAGVSPRMAQTLARHSDIRLTLGLYTHVELHDQTAAIEALPPPPESKKDDDAKDVGQSDAA